MPPVGFKPTISAGERPQTYALDRAATGTGTARYLGEQLTCHVDDNKHPQLKLSSFIGTIQYQY